MAQGVQRLQRYQPRWRARGFTISEPSSCSREAYCVAIIELFYFFLPANRGRGAFRFDYNPSARTFTLFSGNTPGGPWHGTTQTLSLDALPNPPFVISNMRVGLWGRQWNPAAVRAIVLLSPSALLHTDLCAYMQNVAGGIKSLSLRSVSRVDLPRLLRPLLPLLRLPPSSRCHHARPFKSESLRDSPMHRGQQFQPTLLVYPLHPQCASRFRSTPLMLSGWDLRSGMISPRNLTGAQCVVR